MKEIQLTIADISIEDIVKHPDNYPDELIGVSIDALKRIKKDIYEAMLILENHLVNKMTEDEATKMMFKDIDGNPQIITIKAGKTECKEKNADLIYKKAGFDPLEIGTFKFKPSWSKAKEARKFGGYKKEIIDQLFVEGKRGLNFKK